MDDKDEFGQGDEADLSQASEVAEEAGMEIADSKQEAQFRRVSNMASEALLEDLIDYCCGKDKDGFVRAPAFARLGRGKRDVLLRSLRALTELSPPERPKGKVSKEKSIRELAEAYLHPVEGDWGRGDWVGWRRRMLMLHATTLEKRNGRKRERTELVHGLARTSASVGKALEKAIRAVVHEGGATLPDLKEVLPAYISRAEKPEGQLVVRFAKPDFLMDEAPVLKRGSQDDWDWFGRQEFFFRTALTKEVEARSPRSSLAALFAGISTMGTSALKPVFGVGLALGVVGTLGVEAGLERLRRPSDVGSELRRRNEPGATGGGPMVPRVRHDAGAGDGEPAMVRASGGLEGENDVAGAEEGPGADGGQLPTDLGGGEERGVPEEREGEEGGNPASDSVGKEEPQSEDPDGTVTGPVVTTGLPELPDGCTPYRKIPWRRKDLRAFTPDRMKKVRESLGSEREVTRVDVAWCRSTEGTTLTVWRAFYEGNRSCSDRDSVVIKDVFVELNKLERESLTRAFQGVFEDEGLTRMTWVPEGKFPSGGQDCSWSNTRF